jgi:DNA-binding transcriptional LysR family regulator
MEWSDVRVFLAVVRAGTLGGAARALRISHPTVGRRIRTLEQATGHTLFQRTADGFVPTEEGAAIVSLAEQMEESALAMERRLAGQEQRLQGTLRISCADWFGAYVLPPIIDDYAKAYPHVELEILTGTRLFSLAQREADIAFRIVPFDAPDVVQRRLISLPYGAYVAADALEPTFGSGAGFRLITHDMSTGEFPDIAWLRESFPDARPILRSNNRNVQGRHRYRCSAPDRRQSDDRPAQATTADRSAQAGHLDGLSSRYTRPSPPAGLHRDGDRPHHQGAILTRGGGR